MSFRGIKLFESEKCASCMGGGVLHGEDGLDSYCSCMWAKARAADDEGVMVDWNRINELFDAGMGWRESTGTNGRKRGQGDGT